MLRVTLQCLDPHVRDRLSRALRKVHCRHEILARYRPPLDLRYRTSVCCLDSQAAASAPSLPEPCVIVLTGAQVSDELVRRVAEGRCVSLLTSASLNPTTLIEALMAAYLSSETDGLVQRVRRCPPLQDVDEAVITAFLADPVHMTRLADLRRAFAPISRDAARILVRTCGFSRAEHLFTALRMAARHELIAHGLSRTEAEASLGIFDRSSFRRSCRRASLRVADLYPHRESGRVVSVA